MRTHSAPAEYAKRRLLSALAAPGIREPQRRGRHRARRRPCARRRGVHRSARRGNRVSITGGDARGLIYGALEAREQLSMAWPSTSWRRTGTTPSSPFGASSSIRPGTPTGPARRSTSTTPRSRDLEVLGGLPRHDGREPLQRDLAVDACIRSRTWSGRRISPRPASGRDAEFAEWQHLYREIFRMAKERGLDTYVVFWSIFVSEEFSKAHGVAKQNFYPHYYVPATPRTSRNATCARASRRCSRNIRISTASASRTAKAWAA